MSISISTSISTFLRNVFSTSTSTFQKSLVQVLFKVHSLADVGYWLVVNSLKFIGFQNGESGVFFNVN